MSAELLDALAAWRADRGNVALATAVDVASARLPIEQPPRKKQHRWWITTARTYDPSTLPSLLATVTWGARGKSVSWRVVLSRETPLVAELRALGVDETREADEWINLIDRIGVLLTWPDDPRVAMALGALLDGEPFAHEVQGMLPRRHRGHTLEAAIHRAIAHRLSAIGDPRAFERVAGQWRWLDASARNALAHAATRIPAPRAKPHGDPTLDALWDGVVEEPASFERRLVLADALTDRGDPRGEMIALQCAPLVALAKARAAGETFDASALFGASGERVASAIRTHWHRWLGEVGLAASRASRFSGGLLHDVHFGTPVTPLWVWDRIAHHRELCAVHRVSRSERLSAVLYVELLSRLPRMPRWVHVDEDVLEELTQRRPLPFRGVAFGARIALRGVRELLRMCPTLEHVDLGYVVAQDLRDVRDLIAPLAVEVRLQLPYDADGELAAEVRAMPNVVIRP